MKLPISEKEKDQALQFWTKVASWAFSVVFMAGASWLLIPLNQLTITTVSGIFIIAYTVLISAYIRRDKLREEIAELQGKPWSVAKSTWRIVQALILSSVLVFAIVLAVDHFWK